MKRLSLGSLRVRFVLVVVLATIPSLAFIYYNAHSQRSAAIEMAHEDVARITRLTAAHYREVIEGARQLLVAVAQLPEARGDDPARCGADRGRSCGLCQSAPVSCSSIPTSYSHTIS